MASLWWSAFDGDPAGGDRRASFSPATCGIAAATVPIARIRDGLPAARAGRVAETDDATPG
jgi:hypothetical protein